MNPALNPVLVREAALIAGVCARPVVAQVTDTVIDIEGHLSEGPPRWDSRRTVTLPAPIVDELRGHLAGANLRD